MNLRTFEARTEGVSIGRSSIPNGKMRRGNLLPLSPSEGGFQVPTTRTRCTHGRLAHAEGYIDFYSCTGSRLRDAEWSTHKFIL